MEKIQNQENKPQPRSLLERAGLFLLDIYIFFLFFLVLSALAVFSFGGSTKSLTIAFFMIFFVAMNFLFIWQRKSKLKKAGKSAKYYTINPLRLFFTVLSLVFITSIVLLIITLVK